MTPVLGLGTVQLGLPYGITAVGQGPPAAAPILARARELGVTLVDTAAAYGDSERQLGRCGVQGLRVVTKIAALHARSSAEARQRLVAGLQQSLERLRLRAVDTLLLHRAEDLSGRAGSGVLDAAAEMVDRGLIARFGVSVYDDLGLGLVLERFRPDVVQLPLSIVDQRMLRSGAVERLGDLGVEIHLRSVFLQGLLLADPATIPPAVGNLRPTLDRVQRHATEAGMTLLELALGFVAGLPVDAVVVGVRAPEELDACVAAFVPRPHIAYEDLAGADASLLDPRNWER